MTPQEKLRERAVFVLAKLKLITGPVDHYDENISIIEQALIETRNDALEEAASFLDKKINDHYGFRTDNKTTDGNEIRSLKAGEGK